MNNYREAVKKRIMDHFRENKAKTGHVIIANWITAVLFPDLNPKEKEEYKPALNELVADDLIKLRTGVIGDSLELTEKGFNTLY